MPPYSLKVAVLDGSATFHLFLVGNCALAGWLCQEELKALSRVLGRFLGITKNREWSVMTALTFNSLALEVVCVLLYTCYTQPTDIREVACMKSLS